MGVVHHGCFFISSQVILSTGSLSNILLKISLNSSENLVTLGTTYVIMELISSFAEFPEKGGFPVAISIIIEARDQKSEK
jgi:hypothetical protein